MGKRGGGCKEGMGGRKQPKRTSHASFNAVLAGLPLTRANTPPQTESKRAQRTICRRGSASPKGPKDPNVVVDRQALLTSAKGEQKNKHNHGIKKKKKSNHTHPYARRRYLGEFGQHAGDCGRNAGVNQPLRGGFERGQLLGDLALDLAAQGRRRD